MKQLVKYMIDISMGMHYLAEKGLVHRVSCSHYCTGVHLGPLLGKKKPTKLGGGGRGHLLTVKEFMNSLATDIPGKGGGG